jgi:hypothetical protein
MDFLGFSEVFDRRELGEVGEEEELVTGALHIAASHRRPR